MADWLNLGQILRVNAKKFGSKTAVKDVRRAYTFAELNSRVNKLANGFAKMGLTKGDKVSVLLENCTEFVEIYCAAAKTGIVVVTVNFRLIGKEVEYIVENSDSKAFIVGNEFVNTVEEIKHLLENVGQYILVSDAPKNGYTDYEELVNSNPDEEPDVQVRPEDPWVILYTSGTTGAPKGVVRSHESYTAFYLVNGVDFGFTEEEVCMTVMPLYHVNSTFFSFAVTYVGGTLYIHPAQNFDPVEVLDIIEREKITFMSLIPTHYSMILSAPKGKYDTSSIKKLLCSSAPARREVKKRIMEFFPGVELYEGYGSTEAGIVTVLKPYEQLTKLGSIGRESCGTDVVKLLDEDGDPVAIGEVGELYSRGPMLFDKYYKMPEKTEASFRGKWFTARDMARQDEDGYFYLVDRKDNMIITGGEHVYPSEVEEVIGGHPKVKDVAVIGFPDEKWGEAVKAVVVLEEGERSDEKEIVEFCVGKVAKYKKPKSVSFISNEDMPRTGTGKIIHLKLREMFAS